MEQRVPSAPVTNSAGRNSHNTSMSGPTQAVGRALTHTAEQHLQAQYIGNRQAGVGAGRNLALTGIAMQQQEMRGAAHIPSGNAASNLVVVPQRSDAATLNGLQGAGHVQQRNAQIHLQQQLANVMTLNGNKGIARAVAGQGNGSVFPNPNLRNGFGSTSAANSSFRGGNLAVPSHSLNADMPSSTVQGIPSTLNGSGSQSERLPMHASSTTLASGMSTSRNTPAHRHTLGVKPAIAKGGQGASGAQVSLPQFLRAAKRCEITAPVRRVADRTQTLMFAGTNLFFTDAAFQVPNSVPEAFDIMKKGIFDVDKEQNPNKSDLYYRSWSHTQFFAAQMAALGYRFISCNLKRKVGLGTPPPVDQWLRLERLPSAPLPGNRSGLTTTQPIQNLPTRTPSQGITQNTSQSEPSAHLPVARSLTAGGPACKTPAPTGAIHTQRSTEQGTQGSATGQGNQGPSTGQGNHGPSTGQGNQGPSTGHGTQGSSPAPQPTQSTTSNPSTTLKEGSHAGAQPSPSATTQAVSGRTPPGSKANRTTTALPSAGSSKDNTSMGASAKPVSEAGVDAVISAPRGSSPSGEASGATPSVQTNEARRSVVAAAESLTAEEKPGDPESQNMRSSEVAAPSNSEQNAEQTCASSAGAMQAGAASSSATPLTARTSQAGPARVPSTNTETPQAGRTSGSEPKQKVVPVIDLT